MKCHISVQITTFFHFLGSSFLFSLFVFSKILYRSDVNARYTLLWYEDKNVLAQSSFLNHWRRVSNRLRLFLAKPLCILIIKTNLILKVKINNSNNFRLSPNLYIRCVLQVSVWMMQ